MNRFLCAVACIAMLVACGPNTLQHPTDAFAPGQRLGRMKDGALSEASGLAASPNNPGYFWTVNDSGNDANVLLIDTALNLQMVCTLKNIKNRDWEDVMAGPGPDTSKNYLYVGEIGDNRAKHPYKHIYRFEEPKRNTSTRETAAIDITVFDTIIFKLPDGPKDMEALFMDRNTRDLYLVSKREKPVYLYRLSYPYNTPDTLTAEKVMALPLTNITAADLSPDGREMIMKNYEYVYYWRSNTPTSIVSLLAQQPFEVPYEEEPQGEAITWALDGSAFYTLSEHPLGSRVYLYVFKRR